MTEQTQGPQGDRGMLLAQRFVALADSLVDDYDVVDLLDRLVNTCMEVLGVTAVGLLIVDQRGALQPLAASSEETRLIELLQLQSDEGPCLESVHTGVPVTVDDLRSARERWPVFAPAALEVGFRSVHALPMRLREEKVGGLNLFSGDQPPLDEFGRHVAQALADVATIAIIQQRSLHRASQLAEQLQLALNSRIVIEQAKGVLAESGHLDMDGAFRALRSWARSNNRRLSDVAADLVGGRITAAEILRGGDPADLV